MVHKPKIVMYKSTLKITDLQGRILSSWLFSFGSKIQNEGIQAKKAIKMKPKKEKK